MKTLLLNNKSSVAYDDSNPEDIKVFIDNKEHDFKGSTENRIDYAIVTKRNKYAKTLNLDMPQKVRHFLGHFL